MNKLYIAAIAAVMSASTMQAQQVQSFSETFSGGSMPTGWTCNQGDECITIADGYWNATMAEQSNGKYRADMKFEGEASLDASSDKVMAIKFIGTRPSGNLKFEIKLDGVWCNTKWNGGSANGNITTTNGNTIYYFVLTNDDTYVGGAVDQIHFTIADNADSENITYKVDWVATFETVEDLQALRDWMDDGINDADEEKEDDETAGTIGEGTFKFMAVQSGDGYGCYLAWNGSNLVLQTADDDSKQQQWLLTQSGEYYTIRNIATGQYLKSDANWNAGVTDSSSDNYSLWYFTEGSGDYAGSYLIYNVGKGKNLGYDDYADGSILYTDKGVGYTKNGGTWYPYFQVVASEGEIVMPVQIEGGEGYATLAAAVAAAQEGDVIIVNEDQTIDSRLGIGVSLTIRGAEGKDVKITRNCSAIGILMNTGGVEVTMENLTLSCNRGEINYVYAEMSASSGSKLILRDVTIDNVISSQGQGILCCKNAGALEMHNVAFTNCSVTSDAGCYIFWTGNQASLTIGANCGGASVYLEKSGKSITYAPEETEASTEPIQVKLNYTADNGTVIVSDCTDESLFTLINSENQKLEANEGNLVLASIATDGIVSVDAEASGAEYYNLQGMRVLNPESGIYLKIVGNAVSKVYAK